MSKRSDLGDLMGLGKQIKQMQKDMVRAQKELEKETLEVTAAGGAITIVITGHQRVKSISILPEAITPDDPQKLEKLLVAAVNNAIERSQTMAAERLQGLTGGLNIPGLGL